MRTYNLEWASVATQESSLLEATLANQSNQQGVSVDPPLAPRDEAIFLLHVAAEVEHSLLVQYLYAAFSLRLQGPFSGPHVPDQPEKLTKTWFQAILGIAQEEMGHLMTVQNVLRFVGGPLTLEREDFPFRSDLYPFHFRLQPLTKSSLAKYVATERPDKPTGLSQSEQQVLKKLLDRYGERVNRVGVLYDRLIAVMSKLTDDDVRPDLADFQGASTEWGTNDPQTMVQRNSSVNIIAVNQGILVFQVRTRQDATDALTAVAIQGEGAAMAPATGDNSHFRRFFNIYLNENFPDDTGQPMAWHPERPVAVNPNTTRGPGVGEAVELEEQAREAELAKGRIKKTQTRYWAQLFDTRYRILLACMWHSLHIKAPDKSRQTLVDWALSEMTYVRKIAGLLADLDRTDVAADGTAGAPFELPYTLEMSDDNLDRWRMQRNLLYAAAQLYVEIQPASEAEKNVMRDLQADDGTDDGQGRRKTIADILKPPAHNPGGGTKGDTTVKVSFANDIKPLFRTIDIEHMKPRGVLLGDFVYMSDPANNHKNALNVQDYLTGKQTPRMPIGGPYWTEQQSDLYAKWIADGYQP